MGGDSGLPRHGPWLMYFGAAVQQLGLLDGDRHLSHKRAGGRRTGRVHTARSGKERTAGHACDAVAMALTLLSSPASECLSTPRL
jgi:hypothetical protein